MEIIKKEPSDIADGGWGGVVQCTAVPTSDDWPRSLGTCVPDTDPIAASCDFDVVYGDGRKARLSARGRELLCGMGFRCATADADGHFATLLDANGDEARAGDKRMVATAVKALAACDYIPAGEVSLVGEEEAEKTLAACGVPSRPATCDEEYEAEVVAKWRGKWLGEGKVLRPNADSAQLYEKRLYTEWMARIIVEKGNGPLVELADGRKVRAANLTEEDKNLIADPSESAHNASILGGDTFTGGGFAWRE